MKKTHKLATLLMTTVFSFNQITYAQKVETTEDGSIVTYEKEYFEKYAAVTLLDMLLIIPGGKEIVDKNKNQYDGNGADSQGDRGFGSGGDQILIDGKRLAGKTISIDDNLSRISAEQVEKIELIRGATSGLDVQSQGLVINVTLNEGSSNATTFWKVAGKKTVSKDFKPSFTVSRSGNFKGLDYSLSVERDESGYFFNRDEQAFNNNNIKTSDQNVLGGFIWESYKFNTNVGYGFSDDSQIRLNGLFEPGKNSGSEVRNKSTNILNPVARDVNGSSDKWEVGGDYSRSLGALGDLKALFVVNREIGSETVGTTRGSGTNLFEFSNEAEAEIKSEKILRASITKGISEKQLLEIGGEVAINTFDKSFDNEGRNAATEPYSLINSDDVKIKENRYEAFAHHTYNISSQFVLQSSLTTEFSKITADNVFAGGSPTRRDTSFVYFKPRFNLRYDISDRNQIRATIEKNALRDFCVEMSKKAIVLVDEAYFEYVDSNEYATMVSLVTEHRNIVVTRTASKIHAMAGIRVGFAFAHPDTLKLFTAPFDLSMNYMAQMGAIASYQDIEYQNFIRKKNKESLEIIYSMCDDLGLRYVKSYANFVFFHANRPAPQVSNKLREFGVIGARPFAPFMDWVRLSTAKPEEMKIVAKIYKREFG